MQDPPLGPRKTKAATVEALRDVLKAGAAVLGAPDAVLQRDDEDVL